MSTYIVQKNSERVHTPRALVETLEARAQIFAAISDSAWLKVDGINGTVNVFMCVPKNHAIDECRHPMLRFSFRIRAPCNVCTNFFSNLEKQANPDFNPNLKSVEVRRIVKDQDLLPFVSYSKPHDGSDPLVIHFSNEYPRWTTNYKNISYCYSSVTIPAPDGVMLMDSADIVALRRGICQGSWQIVSMGIHMENHVPTVDVRRIESYLSTMSMIPDASDAAYTIVEAVLLVPAKDLDVKSSIELQIEMSITRYVKSIAYLESKNAVSSA